MPTYLSAHFTLEEATISQTASRLGIDNTHPRQEIITTASRTAVHMEDIRSQLKHAIHVDSWIRCLDLNRALKSRDDSQHIKGEAVDFTCHEFGTPLEICKEIMSYGGEFDQLILEHDWVHISWSSLPNARQRNQVLSLLQDGSYSRGLTDKFGNHL